MHINIIDINNIPIIIIIFIAGLFIGSILNVLIYKIPRKLPVFKPYSICFNCKQKKSILYSFPILSYVFRKNFCLDCNAKIYPQNILIELLNALLYVLIYISFGFSLKSLAGIILTSVLIVVSFIDLEFLIIPNIIVLPFTIVGLLISLLSNFNSWWISLSFCFGGFVFMFIIHLIYPKGLGMGDVKLTLMLGAFLVRDIVFALFSGFVLGALAGLILIILKKKKLKQFIPFGPFLATGGFISFFIGDFIIKWYLKF